MGLGDTTLMSKYQLLTEGAAMPAVSLRGAVKLPTGINRIFSEAGVRISDWVSLLRSLWLADGCSMLTLPESSRRAPQQVLAYGPQCPGLPPSNIYGRRTCRSRRILTTIHRRFTGLGQMHSTKVLQNQSWGSATVWPRTSCGKCMRSRISTLLQGVQQTSLFQQHLPIGSKPVRVANKRGRIG
jgi:hypothetical protein